MLNSKENESLETILKVDRNALTFERTTIQMQNISRIWAGYLNKPSFPFLQCIILFGGGAILANMTIPLLFIGLGLLAIGGFVVYHYYSYKMIYTLNLELNSGNIHRFYSKDEDFINKMFKVLSAIIITDSKNEKLLMDFKHANLTIINNSSLIGSNIKSSQNQHKENNNV